MSTKKGKRQKGANQSSRNATSQPKLSTRANVERVLELLADRKQTEAGRAELEEWISELITDAGADFSTLERARMRLALAARRIEQGNQTTAYEVVQDTLVRTANGETLDDIARDREARSRANQEVSHRKELAKPEDKTSDEWRYWKLRQWETAIENRMDEREKYGATCLEFRGMLESLLTEGELTVTDMLNLAPHVIRARQSIERARARGMRAERQGAK